MNNEQNPRGPLFTRVSGILFFARDATVMLMGRKCLIFGDFLFLYDVICFICIIHLSAKGTNGVMKQFQSQRPFFPVLCYPLPVGCWYTTQPEEVSGGAV